MGKKSAAVAKERRTAQRLAERHNKELLARNAAAYTEARLAGIRAEIKAAIPEIGASMAVKAVDVLCLTTSMDFEDDASDRLLDELREALEAHLLEQGFEEAWFSEYHPMQVIDEVIVEERTWYQHECGVLAAAEAELEGLRAQGKGPIVQQPTSILVLQAAAAAAAVKGDKQRVKQQVGPGESKAGPLKGTGAKGTRKGANSTGAIGTAAAQGHTGARSGGQAEAAQAQKLKDRRRANVGRSAATCKQHALQEITAA